MKGNILVISTKEKNYVLAGLLEKYNYNVELGLFDELIDVYTNNINNVDIESVILSSDVLIFEYSGDMDRLKKVSNILKYNNPNAGLILLVDNEEVLPKITDMIELYVTGYATTSESVEKIVFLIHSRVQLLDEIDKLRETNIEIVESLRKVVESKDLYTVGHSERVSRYATLIGKEFNLSNKEMEDLKYGALFHDIGKIGIPDCIIQKETSLTKEEYDEMKRHPEIGKYIVSGLKYLKGASNVILSHHEWYNGDGYPEGIKGAEIDFLARITSACDAFDAITTNRSYRKANTLEYAIKELKRFSGSQFDPKVVNAFENIFEKNREKIEEIHDM